MCSLREPLRLESHNPMIGIPEIYYYDRNNKVVVMQDVGTTLKGSLLAGKINSSQAVAIGCALADFATQLHTWSKTQPQLCQNVSKHHQATEVYLWAQFSRLGETINMVSGGILDGYQETFDQAYKLMVSEMRNPVGCGIIHGDYRADNILVSQNTTNSDTGINRLYVIDWELSMVAPVFFDIGQLSAEVFYAYHFQKRPEAIKLLDAFLGAYRGLDSEDTAARCKVAIVFGSCLVVWPIRVGRGTAEEIEEGVKMGAEYIQKGLQGDVNWLQKSILGELFRESSTQIAVRSARSYLLTCREWVYRYLGVLQSVVLSQKITS